MKQTKLERILDPENFSRKGYEIVHKEGEFYTRKDFNGVGNLIILATKSNWRNGTFLFEGKIIGHDYDIMYGRGYLIMRTNHNNKYTLPTKTIFYRNIHSVLKKVHN